MYRAKVKLHGSNAGIQIKSDGTVISQSRSRIISSGDDNMGFAAWVESNGDLWASKAKSTDYTIFGEWCGKGIMKGVSISQIDAKIFAIFAVQIGSSDDEDAVVYVDPMEIANVVGKLPENVYVLPWYGANFITDYKEDNLAEIVECFNAEVGGVEHCDPWVKEVFGIEGMGEGLVYYPISFSQNNGTILRDHMSKFMFKAKGEKHKNFKTRKAVELDPEVIATVEAFVDEVVTEARMEQAVTEGAKGEFDMKLIGPVIGWFNKDVKKDIDNGEIDLPEGVEWKLVNKPMTTRLRKWYMEKIQEL